MIHNRNEGDVRQVDGLRGLGSERAAFVDQEGLAYSGEAGPNLRITDVANEQSEAQEGSESMGPRIGHGVDLEKTNVGQPVLPREAPGKGDRPGTQEIVPRQRREPRGTEVSGENVDATDAEGVLQPRDQRPGLVLCRVGPTESLVGSVVVPACLEIRTERADVIDHQREEVNSPGPKEAVVRRRLPRRGPWDGDQGSVRKLGADRDWLAGRDVSVPGATPRGASRRLAGASRALPGGGLRAPTVPAGAEFDRLVEAAREAPPDVLIGGADTTALREERMEDVRAMLVGIVLGSRADPAQEDVLPCLVQWPGGVTTAADPVIAEKQDIAEDETPRHGASFVGRVARWAVVASAAAPRAAATRAPTPSISSCVRAARGPGVLFRASAVVVGGGPATGPIGAGRSPPVAIAVLTGARGDADRRLRRKHERSRPDSCSHPRFRTGIKVRGLGPMGGVDAPGRRSPGNASSAEEGSHARIAHVVRMGRRRLGGME